MEVKKTGEQWEVDDQIIKLIYYFALTISNVGEDLTNKLIQ